MTWLVYPKYGTGGPARIEDPSKVGAFVRDNLPGFVSLAACLAAFLAWATILLPQAGDLSAEWEFAALWLGSGLGIAGVFIAGFLLVEWWTGWRDVGVLPD